MSAPDTLSKHRDGIGDENMHATEVSSIYMTAGSVFVLGQSGLC